MGAAPGPALLRGPRSSAGGRKGRRGASAETGGGCEGNLRGAERGGAGPRRGQWASPKGAFRRRRRGRGQRVPSAERAAGEEPRRGAALTSLSRRRAGLCGPSGTGGPAERAAARGQPRAASAARGGGRELGAAARRAGAARTVASSRSRPGGFAAVKSTFSCGSRCSAPRETYDAARLPQAGEGKIQLNGERSGGDEVRRAGCAQPWLESFLRSDREEGAEAMPAAGVAGSNSQILRRAPPSLPLWRSRRPNSHLLGRLRPRAAPPLLPAVLPALLPRRRPESGRAPRGTGKNAVRTQQEKTPMNRIAASFLLMHLSVCDWGSPSPDTDSPAALNWSHLQPPPPPISSPLSLPPHPWAQLII